MEIDRLLQFYWCRFVIEAVALTGFDWDIRTGQLADGVGPGTSCDQDVIGLYALCRGANTHDLFAAHFDIHNRSAVANLNANAFELGNETLHERNWLYRSLFLNVISAHEFF